MKNLILSLVISLSAISAHALQWEIYGPCSNKPTHSGEYKGDHKLSIGEITVDVLEQNKIPYTGTELNIASIDNSATGLDSMEVISDTELRAYGWCYSVNNVIPDVMPSDYYAKSEKDRLVWFYGYYSQKDGVWSGPCMPSYDIKAEQFCGK